MKVTTGTIVRTIVLVIALFNQIMTITGHSMLPFSDEEIEQGVSMAVTTIAALWAWWKNNSFTQDHIEADAKVKEKRMLRKYIEESEREQKEMENRK